MKRQPGTGSHARNIAWSLAGNVAAPVMALGTAPILAQGLGVDGRGELSAATAPLLLAAAVGAFGLPEAVIHHTAKNYGSARRSATIGLTLISALGAVAALLIFALAGPLSAGNDELKTLIRVTAAVVLPTIVLLVPRATIAGTHNWRILSIERALFGAFRLGWILFLWLTGALTPLSATIAWVVSPLVSGLVFFPVAFRTLRSAGAATDPEQVSWRIITGYGLRIWLGALSGIVLTRISQVLMVPLSSEAQAGLFAVAVTIGEIPLIISGAVRDVTFSTDSAMASDERLQQTCRVTFQLTLLVSVGIGMTMSLWLPTLFGSGFAAGIPAALIVLAATVIGSPGSVAGSGLSARGRPGLRSWSMFYGALANLTILLLVTPRLGAVGAALSMLVGNFIAGNGNIFFLHSRFGLPWVRFVGFRREDLAVYQALTRKLMAVVT